MINFIDLSKPLSLYVHIPFCVSKCSYCAFYSVSSLHWNGDILNKYTDLVSKQISSFLENYKKPFDTVFIGGGNPGVLGAKRLLKIFESAFTYGRARECSLEVNPEQIPDVIGFIKPYVTRISIGIQSMDSSMLSFLGRNSTRKENLDALEILCDNAVPFNADIITGVPGFPVDKTLSDINLVSSFNPSHISFYCLSYEEGTKMWNKRNLADEEVETSCLRHGWDLLESLGYEHYEISNFARKKAYCLHNLNYWQLGQYVGFGPSAESSFGYERAVSMRYDQDVFSYISSPDPDFEFLSPKETEEEFLMVALRTKWGIDKKEYEKRFSYSFDQKFSSTINSLDESLFQSDEKSFHLTEEGFLFSDRIVLKLFGCLID